MGVTRLTSANNALPGSVGIPARITPPRTDIRQELCNTKIVPFGSGVRQGKYGDTCVYGYDGDGSVRINQQNDSLLVRVFLLASALGDVPVIVAVSASLSTVGCIVWNDPAAPRSASAYSIRSTPLLDISIAFWFHRACVTSTEVASLGMD